MPKTVATALPPSRVLIVDDHPNTATMLARVIRKVGPQVEVLTASSGEDALHQLGDGIADILITDFMMPGMSGLELIERLKDSQKPSHTILVTAYNTPGLAATTRNLDIQNYLVKPVDPEKIQDIVSKALSEIVSYQEDPSVDSQQRPFKILIADDHPDNIRLLQVRLRNEGYEHVVATDGTESLEKLRSESPDLALLDVNMPNKDGFEVLKEMRADDAISHIPAIMITAARLGVKDIQEGLALGADDYITKPVDWRELSARIRTKLRVKRAEDILRTRNQELGVLPEISKDLGERLDIEDLTKTLLTRTVKALDADNGHLVIFHLDGDITFQMHKIFDFSPWTWGELQNRITSQGVVEKVSRTHEIEVLDDVDDWGGWLRVPNDPTRAAIAVPLMGRKDVIGVLTLTHSEPEHFSLDHENIIKAIASQAAIAVENAQLYAGERKRVNELVALNQITREIGAYTHSPQLFDEVPGLIKSALGYPAVALWLMETGVLNLRNISGGKNAPRQSMLEIGPIQAASLGQPVQLSGPVEERSSDRKVGGSPPVQSVIAVPLMQGKNTQGVLSIHSKRANAFQESDRVLLETLSAQVSTVFERISLFESVEQEKSRLAAVLDGAADAILMIDDQGILQLANPEGERLFTDIDAQVGQPLPLDQGYDELITILNAGTKTDPLEGTEIPWPDGRTFSAKVTGIDDSGSVVVLHDVSHFKGLDKIKNEFIATASHDLKNPIHAVLGYSDLLEKAGPLNEMQTDFVECINRSAKLMHELVINTLDLVRVDLGVNRKYEPVDIEFLVSDVIEDLRAQADMRKQTLEMDLPKDPTAVMGDPGQLRQVLRNLVGNAMKYSPDEALIRVEAVNNDSQAIVHVKDNGMGIPEDDLPFIFDKFYRVQSEGRQDIEGNGLGLAIVKSIIEQHDGQIIVTSALGKGSCFSFNLPLVENQEVAVCVDSNHKKEIGYEN